MTAQQQSAHGKDGVPTLPSMGYVQTSHIVTVCAPVEQSWWDRTVGTCHAQHCFADNSFFRLPCSTNGVLEYNM